MSRFLPPALLHAILTLVVAGCGAPPAPQASRAGMVVSGDSLASAAGLAVLRGGGNAVDAAVAVGFVLAVTFPEAGNIGGGGFMLVRFPDGSARSIDFRETAPMGASAEMYLGREGASVDGALAAATPGTVAGLLLSLERYGTADRRSVLRAAIDLAASGFRVDARLAGALDGYREALERYPSTARVFFRDGRPLREGETLVQPDLAATLRLIADSGAPGFYAGRTAGLIAAQVSAGGGLLDAADLASYRAVERTPLRGTYRGYTIDAMGLPSSGGICILHALSLLEPYDLASLGFHSPESVHLITEAMKRAFALRAAYLGDGDFVDVPVEALLRAPGRARRIDPSRAADADSLSGYPRPEDRGSETTHFSVIDREGMAVAVTYTVNDLFGNKEVVDGAGFFLNDEMDDFVTVPGTPNLYGLVGGEENMIRPGKRPLSSMSPTIVSKDGRPVLIIGARGGSRIISAVLQSVINIVDHGLPPRTAVLAPRFHHQWSPDRLSYERGAFPGRVMERLGSLGHRLAGEPSVVGAVEAIWVDARSGEVIGIPDPREGGAASGY